jgi:hypothetical protein
VVNIRRAKLNTFELSYCNSAEQQYTKQGITMWQRD